ncbi:hypothetical protein A0256_02055 [Mucilaginibacter sp. PAMC 26640]|nr:hypothetical protein A0256_02055 [Mucilaginibacter sp. PAMC 26640]
MNAVLYEAQLDLAYPRLIGFNELSRFAIAPSLYLAIVQFTTPGSKLPVNSYLHFIPFAIFFIYMVPALYFPAYQLIGGHFSLPPRLNFIAGLSMRWSINIQLLVYWILAFNCLRQHQNHIQLVASNLSPVSLNWLRYLLLSIGGMLLVFFISIIFQVQVGLSAIATGYLAGALIILYYAIAQKEIYPFEVAELKAINQIIIASHQPSKPITQRFDDDRATQLRARLEKLMTVDKLYLDNELSLPQLAVAVNLSVHDLSFLLNEKIGSNFFQFVNSYRVEEAKQLMQSGKHKNFNILGIAYSAGFSSKTTFNTAFKKETGLSPSQFIAQHNKVASALSQS